MFKLSSGRVGALLVAGVLSLGLVGCKSAPESDVITAKMIRDNPTPDLDTLARMHEQNLNEYARVIDHNTRAAWNDLESILLIDHASSLTMPYWVP